MIQTMEERESPADSYSVHEKIEASDVGRLFRQYWETGDLQYRDQIIISHQPLVRRIARIYARGNIAIESLISAGNIALIKATDRYRMQDGAKFSTYAYAIIAGEMKHYIRDIGWKIKVPRRLKQLWFQVKGAVDRLSQDLMRAPTIPEIAAELGVTEMDVHEAMEVGHAYHPMPIHAPAALDGDERGTSLEESLGTEDRNIEYAEYQIDMEKAIGALNEREQKIIKDRYYLNLSQTDIATQLGMSQAHVSRILNHALKDLEVMLTS